MRLAHLAVFPQAGTAPRSIRPAARPDIYIYFLYLSLAVYLLLNHKFHSFFFYSIQRWMLGLYIEEDGRRWLGMGLVARHGRPAHVPRGMFLF